jgi:hypothetical protein
VYGDVIASVPARLLALQFAAAVILRAWLRTILVGETPTAARGS